MTWTFSFYFQQIRGYSMFPIWNPIPLAIKVCFFPRHTDIHKPANSIFEWLGTVHIKPHCKDVMHANKTRHRPCWDVFFVPVKICFFFETNRELKRKSLLIPLMTQLELLSPGCTRLVRNTYGLFPTTNTIQVQKTHALSKGGLTTRKSFIRLLSISRDLASLRRGCAVIVMTSQGFPAKLLHRVMRR